MADESPDEPSEFETVQKIAVNGKVVSEVRMKPGALVSDVEEETFSAVLTAQFVEAAQEDGGEALEMLEKYDPEIQIWAEEMGDGDEPAWSSPRKLSKTQFLDVCEEL